MGANEVRTTIQVWSIRAKVALLLLASFLGLSLVGIAVGSTWGKARSVSSASALVPGGSEGLQYVLLPEFGLAFLGAALWCLVWIEIPRKF
ncbi:MULTISPECIES: hypothetical protein [Halostella]|uniref:hypothetical protein n=1 Tax=Halostella TaxID=1843185 RepID=UPI001081DEED|nr:MULTISPECIES: hypothetical protein [Halostella]